MGETPDQGQYTGVSCGLDLNMTRFSLRELASYVKRHLYGFLRSITLCRPVKKAQ